MRKWTNLRYLNILGFHFSPAALAIRIFPGSKNLKWLIMSKEVDCSGHTARLIGRFEIGTLPFPDWSVEEYGVAHKQPNIQLIKSSLSYQCSAPKSLVFIWGYSYLRVFEEKFSYFTRIFVICTYFSDLGHILRVVSCLSQSNCMATVLQS